MKNNKNFKRIGKSYTLLSKGFIGLVIVLVCVTSFLRYCVGQYLENKYYLANLENFVANVDTFDDDDYANMQFEKYVGEGGKVLFFDDQWKLVYANDIEYVKTLSIEELKYVCEYKASYWYETVDFRNKNNEERQILFKKTYGEDGLVITNYALIDKDNRIVSGELFPVGTKLESRTVSYLIGQTGDGYMVFRHSYLNPSGQNRILIFFTPNSLPEEYIKAMAIWERSQWWIVLGYAVIVIVFIYLISYRIKKYLTPLHRAISEYKVGQEPSFEMSYEGPNELVELAECFSELKYRLDESEEKRQYLEDSKKRLLADISHDLRTPLTTVRGYVEAIRDGVIPPEQSAKYMEIIYEKTCKIEELLNTFHQYSLLEHPDMPIDLKCCNICAVVQEYFADKYADIEFAGFQIDANIPEDPLYCMVDRILFTRALDNIVNNSLRYNTKGTTIAIAIKENGNNIQIRIGDNGVGINRENREKLFDCFVKEEKEGGSGLGLAITKKIITAHRGGITLCDEETQGMKTLFDIVIPIVMECDSGKSE